MEIMYGLVVSPHGSWNYNRDNTVIGAGSVITRDIPANVVAAGAPCRVIREITEADKSDYFNVLETLYDGGK